MNRSDYRTLYNQIYETAQNIAKSNTKDFDFTPYVWVYNIDGQVEAACCDTDDQMDDMYPAEFFVKDYFVDENTSQLEVHIDTAKVHEITRK